MTLLPSLHLVLGGALVVLTLQSWANRHALPRLRPGRHRRSSPRISVLIPARNEAARIARVARRWAAQTYGNFEVLIYDDQSSDGTAARARAAAPAVRVIGGEPLPAGWRGKPHACHRLRQLASGELLVFADADVLPAPEVLPSSVAALEQLGVSVFSALPRHHTRTRLLLALAAIQHWVALTFLPVWLHDRSRHRAFAALNGQFLVIEARVYDAVGGFAAVRWTLGEDTALARRLATAGFRAPLLDGSQLLTCEPYDSVRQAWSANTRQLLPVFFGSATLLLGALAGLGVLYVAPWLLLAISAYRGLGWSLVLAIAEILLGIGLRGAADLYFGYPLSTTLLQPIVVPFLIAMGIASVSHYRLRGTVDWRGRAYDVTE